MDIHLDMLIHQNQVYIIRYEWHLHISYIGGRNIITWHTKNHLHLEHPQLFFHISYSGRYSKEINVCL